MFSAYAYDTTLNDLLIVKFDLFTVFQAYGLLTLMIGTIGVVGMTCVGSFGSTYGWCMKRHFERGK